MKMGIKPAHPGVLFHEGVMKPLGLSVTEAARLLGTSRKTLSALTNARGRLTPDLAMRIALATRTSVGSWLNMQAQLDAWMIERRKPKNVTVFPGLPSVV